MKEWMSREKKLYDIYSECVDPAKPDGVKWVREYGEPPELIYIDPKYWGIDPAKPDEEEKKCEDCEYSEENCFGSADSCKDYTPKSTEPKCSECEHGEHFMPGVMWCDHPDMPTRANFSISTLEDDLHPDCPLRKENSNESD